jgi:hypothetical protein
MSSSTTVPSLAPSEGGEQAKHDVARLGRKALAVRDDDMVTSGPVSGDVDRPRLGVISYASG